MLALKNKLNCIIVHQEKETQMMTLSLCWMTILKCR